MKKTKGGGDLGVTQIPYRKKNVKNFLLRGKEGGGGGGGVDLNGLFQKNMSYLFFFTRKSIKATI